MEERISKLFKEQEEAMDAVTTQLKDDQAKVQLSMKNLGKALVDVHDRLDTVSELHDKGTAKLELRTSGLEDRTDTVTKMLGQVIENQDLEAELSKKNALTTEASMR